MDASALGWKVFEALSPALLASLSWLSAKAAQLIAAKVKSEYLRGVLVRLDDAVFVAVREAEQVMVQALKVLSADGRLTPDERAKVKQAALDSIKSHLGAKGVAEVEKILGLDSVAVQKMFSTRVEAAVHEMNAFCSKRSSGATGGTWNSVPSSNPTS